MSCCKTLLTASTNGHEKCIEIFLQNGANIHEKTYYGCTSLILALINNNNEIIKLLLQNGANIHDKTYDGTTPLMIILEYGYTKCIDSLLKVSVSYRDRRHYDYGMCINFALDYNYVFCDDNYNEEQFFAEKQFILKIKKIFYQCIELLLQNGALYFVKNIFKNKLIDTFEFNTIDIKFKNYIFGFVLIKTVELENINITDKQIEMLYFVLNYKLNYNYVFDILKLIFGRVYFIKNDF